MSFGILRVEKNWRNYSGLGGKVNVKHSLCLINMPQRHMDMRRPDSTHSQQCKIWRLLSRRGRFVLCKTAAVTISVKIPY
jgi:hypothetical protein